MYGSPNLHGFVCKFISRFCVEVRTLREGIYKAELVVVASAEWNNNVLCKLAALLHLDLPCCYNAKPNHELTPAHVM